MLEVERGWKTKVSAIGLILLGIGGALAGDMSWLEAARSVLEGLMALGIGHKIVKSARDYRRIAQPEPEAEEYSEDHVVDLVREYVR